jgi:2-polyprenyl-3-methyl-5-hydroxy-6-metoxy-1,4-benzoquinol methylase
MATVANNSKWVANMDSALYDELHRVEQTHWWFRARRHIVWSLVERFSGGSQRQLSVCELGCGTGGNLVAAAKQHEVIGVECSPEALAYAQGSLGSRVRFGRLPDAVGLPASTFDVVLLADVLEHIEQDATSAATALKLLKPGGIVVATVPAYQWLYSPRDAHHHHFRRYGKRQFAALWHHPDAETILLSHYNTSLFPLAALARLRSKYFGHSSAAGDLRVPLRIVNSALTCVMATESALLGRAPLPFGLSLIAVVRKRAAGDSDADQVAA